MNGVEPCAWLKDTLEKITAGHPDRRIDELLPLELHHAVKLKAGCLSGTAYGAKCMRLRAIRRSAAQILPDSPQSWGRAIRGSALRSGHGAAGQATELRKQD